MVRATSDQEDGDVPRTVLIVDDHPAFRTVAERLLTARGRAGGGAGGAGERGPRGGCGVVWGGGGGWAAGRGVGVAAVGGGEECAEAVRRLRPGGVLLDVGLPDG